MEKLEQTLEQLLKTLEAGQYNVAPGQLTQGSALQIEDLSPVMQNVTFEDSHIKLQKMFPVKACKSLLVQFDRQLSYGRFGGSAQREGAVGDVDVGDYIRATVPMAFYSHIRRVTLAADMVATVDGKKGSDREADNAPMKLAGDIEFDAFKGKADFSNAGVFDGNPAAMARLPNMLGLDCQIRQSDILANTQDLMFAAWGSNQSVVFQSAGNLTQKDISNAFTRSRMNMGKADQLVVDPIVLNNFNTTSAMAGLSGSVQQRIILSGSAQDVAGADLRRQFVSGGIVSIEDSRFLSGKTGPNVARLGAPAAVGVAATAFVEHAAVGPFLINEVVVYLVTAENERGESQPLVLTHTMIAAGSLEITINEATISADVVSFNFYRGASAATAKYIGRVKKAGTGSTSFSDLDNRRPGFVSGFLIQKDVAGFHELSSYKRLKLAIRDLSTPEAHFRFLSLAVYQPRKLVLIDNLRGDLF